MQEPGKAGAILKGKCPRCRQGNIFRHSAYAIPGFHKMYTHCPKCGVQYEREPGFFFGAMYVSYAFSVAIFVAVGLALSLIGDFSLLTYLIAIIVVVLLLLPLLFRFSRILFLYWFGGIDFDPEYSN